MNDFFSYLPSIIVILLILIVVMNRLSKGKSDMDCRQPTKKDPPKPTTKPSASGLSYAKGPGLTGLSTPNQEELIRKMRNEGLLSCFEEDRLLFDRSYQYASEVIDRHKDRYLRILYLKKTKENFKTKAAEHGKPEAPSSSALDDNEGLKKHRDWLDLGKLPDVDAFPVAQRNDGLMTKREEKLFNVLDHACSAYHLKLCPKVRIADILDVRTDDAQENKIWFRTMAQMHVDFTILDQNNKLLCALELDDSSHDTEKAREKDRFKSGCFEKAGIPLYRMREIPKNDEEALLWVKVMLRVLDKFKRGAAE